MGLPVMDHDGKFQFLCQTDLFPESLELNIPGRVVSIKVQANLSIGFDFLMPAELLQGRIGLMIDLFCIMGMDAEDGINGRMGLSNLKSPLPILFLCSK